MSYKFTTGSVRKGDIYYEDDRQGEPTYIDFGLDTITLRPSGSAILFAEDDAVGIGTTNPQTTLHVKGDPGQFRVEDTTVDYAYTIDCDGDGIRTHFGDMTGGGDEDSFMSFGAYTGINRLDTAARDFHIYGTNTTTGFYFDESAGKFGIGTTTPTYTLDVAGDIGFNEYLRHNDDADTYLRLLPDTFDIICGGVKLISYYETGNDAVHVNPQNGDVNFIVDSDTEDNSLFVEGSSGNVGIGTGAPYSTLQVVGSLQFKVNSVAGDTTLDDTHHVVAADCNSGNVTVTLPSVSESILGRQYIIKRADTGGSGGGNSLTIARNGANIDGTGSDLGGIDNGTSHTLICLGGAGWIIVDKYVGG